MDSVLLYWRIIQHHSRHAKLYQRLYVKVNLTDKKVNHKIYETHETHENIEQWISCVLFLSWLASTAHLIEH
ncbi:hypothetical protein UC8_47910 [Roseimaritima ulvae]|uniref:Uncharacterized protein n=1 Tax=Roseimaritima ulvae TaxID=980254 RepID=A0A5B9QY07_9BACT|nr:hypothetical protein UC8_47910 [Roseimaritima ulvae]